MSFSLRLDLLSSTDNAISLIKGFSNIYAYCLEDLDGDNPHLHAYIQSDLNIRTIRSRIRNNGYTGNGKYSLKKCDELIPIKYLAYLMKQNKFVSQGLDSNVLNEAREYDEKIKNDLKNKKINKKNNSQLCYEYVKSHALEPCSKYDPMNRSLPFWLVNSDIQLARLSYSILEFHIINNLSIRDFHIKSLTSTFYFKLIKEQHPEKLDSAILWYSSQILKYGPFQSSLQLLTTEVI